ncbi:MAG TPA: hypothetical protein VMU04_25605 [Candidatus Acidoferrum sp.]|nr:hypothetical protein [Candidatus Acidoferrum sp.]
MKFRPQLIIAKDGAAPIPGAEPAAMGTTPWCRNGGQPAAEQERDDLLRSIQLGNPLTLAEYVRAEELLVQSSCSRGAWL